MTFKCPFCERILSTRTAYTQHKTICMKAYEEEDNIITDMNDMSLDSEGFSNPIEEVYLNFNKCIYLILPLYLPLIIIDGLAPRFPRFL